MKPLYAHIQIRKSEVEPSSRVELRRIFTSNGVEWVRWQNQKYEIYVDPALDVYYLVLGKTKVVSTKP